MKLIAKNTVVFFLSLAIAVISFPKPNAGSPLISATTDASSAQVGVNDSNAETVAMSGFSGKTYCTENDTSDWVDSVNEFIRSSINTTQDDMMTHYTANTASDSSVASSPLDCSTDADGIPPYNDSVATTMVPSPEISTDMTASIVFMLKQYGVCHLNEGVYYVSGIDMPDDSMLIGSGAKTVIRLSDNGDYAIKMNKRNKVANMTIAGSSKAIALNETVGNRHGILWSVNYYDSNKPCYGILDGLWIKSFNGGGITCSNTGYGTTNFISATNINIMNCNAGINIAHWSEYHKFTNVRTYGCYYGCINNGGNNNFVNCDFSECKLGFLMDNTDAQSPNNSHGSAVGCTFNHTNKNSGIGIKIIGCNNGYIFTGCQIFYSKIDIQKSSGIVISSCDFGAKNCAITISGGGAVLFSNNTHQAQPQKNITNNSKVKFANCYVRSSGEEVSLAD